jgi:hypothetical protein
VAGWHPETVISRWRDPVVLAATCAGLVGLGWLVPLMFDQMTFFGDEDQVRGARRSMVLMIPAAGLILLSASGVWHRVGPWHGLLVVLPAVVSVPLAWTLPEALFQLLSFGLTAPLALGALLSSAFPLPLTLPRTVQLLAVGGLAFLAVAGAPYLALAGLVIGAVWWLLSARR